MKRKAAGARSATPAAGKSSSFPKDIAPMLATLVAKPPRGKEWEFKTERQTLLNPAEETQTKLINGHPLKFTNLGKVYWPKEGHTKRDMLNYYYRMAPVMLPYYTGKPQTLNRYPNGITARPSTRKT
jgi:hypothetical protein